MAEDGKKPFYKKWWFWVLAIILILIFASMGGDDEDQPTAVDDNGTETADNNNQGENVQDNGGGNEAGNGEDEGGGEEEAAPKDVFSVGEQVQLGDNVLTVTKVEKSNGTDFDKPKEGKEYVIVHVQIQNAGDENISYNPFDFKMANSQGQIQDVAFTTVDSDTSLQSGELAPGGNVTGTLSFEQPAGDPGLQLQYEPSFWSDEIVKINLQ